MFLMSERHLTKFLITQSNPILQEELISLTHPQRFIATQLVITRIMESTVVTTQAHTFMAIR